MITLSNCKVAVLTSMSFITAHFTNVPYAVLTTKVYWNQDVGARLIKGKSKEDKLNEQSHR